LTVYKHLHSRLAEPGDLVARGHQIGTMGATGAMGLRVHLHFEVLKQPRGQRAVANEPHLFWADGVGQVTCFDPAKVYSDRAFLTTYPVRCK